MPAIRIFQLVLAMMAALALTGCNEEASEAYRRGVQEGENRAAQEANAAVEAARAAASAAYALGQADGSRVGFERARPSSSSALTGTPLAFYKLLVWGGAIKLVGSLAFAALFLFKKTDSVPQIVGKVVFSILGAVGGVLLASYFKVAGPVLDILLFRVPSSLWVLSFIFLLAACGTAGIFTLLQSIVRAKLFGTYMEALLLAGIAAMLSIAAPMLSYLYTEVPDITGYLASPLFLGAFMGGLYWIGHRFLTSKGESLSSIEPSTSSK